MPFHHRDASSVIPGTLHGQPPCVRLRPAVTSPAWGDTDTQFGPPHPASWAVSCLGLVLGPSQGHSRSLLLAPAQIPVNPPGCLQLALCLWLSQGPLPSPPPPQNPSALFPGPPSGPPHPSCSPNSSTSVQSSNPQAHFVPGRGLQAPLCCPYTGTEQPSVMPRSLGGLWVDSPGSSPWQPTWETSLPSPEGN